MGNLRVGLELRKLQCVQEHSEPPRCVCNAPRVINTSGETADMLLIKLVYHAKRHQPIYPDICADDEYL